MNILVTGGAGYIGSHMVQMLIENGDTVTTIDNFSTGFRNAVTEGELIEGDLSDKAQLKEIFSTHSFDCVIHFAAFSQVGESIIHPELYYGNNVCNTINLLDIMIEHDVRNIVFSSSAALFGNPQYIPIDENHPCSPINPYGHSKLMTEQILKDYQKAFGLQHISLRYFNAAGASLNSSIGERHNPETHLIPITLQVANGTRDCIHIYGTDYNTPDGTCIRDYIHVVDLCHAHLLSINYLLTEKTSNAFNLGNGQGYSVMEIIKETEKVTNQPIPFITDKRRVGDPDRLIADSTRIHNTLGWEPHYSKIKTIINHAWQWTLSNNKHHPSENTPIQ